MSASTAIASMAAMNASLAAHAAQQARKTACAGFAQSYEARTATVEDRQEYASCVDLLWPREAALSPADAIALKFAIVVTILAMPVCGVAAYVLARWDRWEMTAIWFFFGPMLTAAFFGVLGLAWIGLKWVFA